MHEKSVKEEIQEVLLIIKACFTTFWFWLPALFASYLYLQIWMIFSIHPLTIFILPTILTVYLTYEREKRIKMMYKVNNVENYGKMHLSSSLEREEVLEYLYKEKIREMKKEEEGEENIRQKND